MNSKYYNEIIENELIEKTDFSEVYKVIIKFNENGKNFFQTKNNEEKVVIKKIKIHNKKFNNNLLQEIIPFDNFFFNFKYFVKYYDIIIENDYVYIIMKFYDFNLYNIIKNQLLNDNEKEIITFKLIDSIINLHNKNIIHNDLKPENIIISHENNKYEIKLIDYGFSRQGYCELKKINYSHQGSKLYLSPNKFFYNYTDHPNDDWWSLGCIIFELYTGIPLFISGYYTIKEWKKNFNNFINNFIKPYIHNTNNKKIIKILKIIFNPNEHCDLNKNLNLTNKLIKILKENNQNENNHINYKCDEKLYNYRNNIYKSLKIRFSELKFKFKLNIFNTLEEFIPNLYCEYEIYYNILYKSYEYMIYFYCLIPDLENIILDNDNKNYKKILKSFIDLALLYYEFEIYYNKMSNEEFLNLLYIIDFHLAIPSLYDYYKILSPNELNEKNFCDKLKLFTIKNNNYNYNELFN